MLEISTKNLPSHQEDVRLTVDGLDGNGLLKAYVFFMEDKMAAEAFGRARNYG